jgi:hypothetical protein
LTIDYISEEYRNVFKLKTCRIIMQSSNEGKTTVTFPVNLLMALRAYMFQENISPHKQSEIIAEALQKYLIEQGIKIPPNDGRVYKYSVVLQESD